MNNDLFLDLKRNTIDIINELKKDWKISLIDTGLDTKTGGRLKRIRDYLNDDNVYN